MKHRLATKSLLLLVGLFVVFYAHGQNGLSPYKLTIFQDAAQVGWKGIVRFHQQSAEVPLAMNVNANGMDLIPGTSDVQIKSFRVRQDTLITQSLVQNWADVLRANISRKVTILYVIGNEYDEVSGSVRLINDLAGMLLLRGIDNSEYFIPLDEIKQVVVQGKSDFKIDQKTLQDVLEINLSKDVPFVPMEMFTLDPNIHWKPVCRIRILGSDKALLQMLALIQNGENALKDVDVDLSTANMLTQAGSDAEIIEMGNISLDPGDELMVNFRETQLTYQLIYRSSIAWNESYLDGKGHIFPVNNT
ncbi:MAG TPA: hypothetical protein ENJ82_08575, partial [Bacteroidetes bacterium]|nr:hypothetical protein [Bacteroidota bacterium]